jgi:hypothetical protein
MTLYTPNLALPYPEASDAPRGWEQIEALAEALDGATAPTWYDIPLADGMASATGYTARMCWDNGRVYLSGALNAPNGGWDSSSPGNTIGTLPAGYRPSRTFYVPGQSGALNGNVRIGCTAAGTLTALVESNGSSTTSAVWLDNVSFFSSSASIPTAPSAFAVRPGPRAEDEPVIDAE